MASNPLKAPPGGVNIPFVSGPAVFRFGLFELDPGQGELRRAGRRVPLQQQPFRALVLLVSRAGRLVTREELRAELWPPGTHVDFDRGINFCMNQVRVALRDPARSSHFVETVPRLGYRFLAEVSEAAAAAASSPAPAMATAAARRRAWPALACALALAITTGGGAVKARRPTGEGPTDPGARQSYLRGLMLLQGPDAGAWPEAARELARAVAADPTAPAPQAALARALIGLGQAGLRPAAEVLPRARDAALAALREDPRMADAWVSLSLVRLHLDWDWRAGEDIDRALALDPGLARAHRARAALLSARGDHEGALAAARRAASLDPLCPTLRGDLGWYHYCAGRYADAAAEWRLSVAVAGEAGPRDRLVDAFRHLGRAEDAWREAEATMRSAGIPAPAIADLARRGPEGAVRAFLSGSAAYLSRRGAPLVRLAALHAAAGEDDRALAVLEQAARERSWGVLGSLGVDPDFEGLRDLPRYRRLLRETGKTGPNSAASSALASILLD